MSESYIGRGLEPIAGRPFGYAFNREREEIRRRLLDRGRAVDDWKLESRITKIQHRLWKNRPTYAERHDARRARQPIARPTPTFSREQLERLVELFEGANDPLTAAIGAAAADMLKRL